MVNSPHKIVIITAIAGAVLFGAFLCLISLFAAWKRQETISDFNGSVKTGPTVKPTSYRTVVTVCDYAGEQATWALQTSGPATRYTQRQNESCFDLRLVMSTLGQETLIVYRCEDAACKKYKNMYFENMHYLFQDKSEIHLAVSFKKDEAGKDVFNISKAQ